MAKTSNCSHSPQRIPAKGCLTVQRHQKKRKDIRGEAGDWVDWGWVSSELVQYWYLTSARGLLLVQGGGGAPSAAAPSQESVEFDAWAKSCPFPLKGYHWRGKQQTESQCDCLSNEKIRWPHLTENESQLKDWVNKKLLLQMGGWRAGACADTWTTNVSQAELKKSPSPESSSKWAEGRP